MEPNPNPHPPGTGGRDPQGKGRSFRSRIFISFLAGLLPVLALLAAAVELMLVPYLESRTWGELANSTRVLTNAVRAGASMAIRNHLKGIGELNREIARHHLDLVHQGVLTRPEAVSRLRRILLSQRVGSSGYLYCIDSQGIAVVHPVPAVEGTDASNFDFVQEQMRRKQGYLEYEWRNPGEPYKSKKALYMVYFEPLDWIISVSCYRSELNKLLNPDDFRDTVLSLRFGESGYSYVFDDQGTVLIHPSLKGVNVLSYQNVPTDFVRTMLDRGSGMMEYRWRNPEEPSARTKMAVYESLPEYGWVVVSSAYPGEVLKPVRIARNLSYGGLALLLLAAGVTAYLLSGRLTRPVEAMVRRLDENAHTGGNHPLPVAADSELARLAREFNTFLDLIHRKNEELRRERDFSRALIDASPAYIIILDPQGRIRLINPAFCRTLGCSPGEAVGDDYFELAIPPRDRTRIRNVLEALERSANRGEPVVRVGANPVVTRHQGERMVQWTATWLPDDHGRGCILLAVGVDITEERSLQDQLHHVQKLEAMGRLAGGVAHDLNNMLGGIMGAAELLRVKLDSEHAALPQVRMIIETVERAAELAGRLLAFSRKGNRGSTPVAIHKLLRDAFRIFRSGLDPRIETEIDLGGGGGTVVGDPSQLQSAFLNLFINARDAMPGGGTLRVATRDILLDESACAESPFDLDPGPYVEVLVADTGTGMEESVRAKIFEPFFTTKAEGKGTGLGLALVFGAIKDHRGEVRVESAPGVGTKFNLRLPRVEMSAAPPETEKIEHGAGTILLVDDDEVLRTTGRLMLEELGYSILTACDGIEAVERFRTHRSEIDLVLLDMVMPRMNGRETFYAIRSIDPGARIILASGFGDRKNVRDLHNEGLLGFLQKPYRLRELSAAVQKALKTGPHPEKSKTIKRSASRDGGNGSST